MVLMVVENYIGNTYRAVYTVKFGQVVYVLHCFQKKTLKTRKEDIDLAQKRYKEIGG